MPLINDLHWEQLRKWYLETLTKWSNKLIKVKIKILIVLAKRMGYKYNKAEDFEKDSLISCEFPNNSLWNLISETQCRTIFLHIDQIIEINIKATNKLKFTKKKKNCN